jgi:predicted nucleic acid-binding protein
MMAKHARGPAVLVIDTNVLLVLLGYQCLQLDNARGLERERVLNEIRGREDVISPARFDDLWNLFHTSKRRIVTPHVIAETYGLRKLLAFPKDLIWDAARTILDRPGIEEQSCLLSEVFGIEGYRTILKELGPADAGLIYTAERHKATVISDDGGLRPLASARSVTVLALKQLGNW